MPQTTITNISNRVLNPGVANTGNVNWVAGLNGGRNWKMYPNTTDILMDNVNNGIMYIKSCDETGAIKVFRAYKYDEIPLEDVPLQDVDTPGLGNFVTKNDLDAFKADLIETIKNMNAQVPVQNQPQNNYRKKKPNYNNGGNQYDERS